MVYAIYSDQYDVWRFSGEDAGTLTTTGKAGNWYQIQYNGTTAYIIEDYVTEN